VTTPWSYANTIAAARSRTPSLPKMLPTWVLTVASATTMRRKLATQRGRELYRSRKQIAEPVFAQTKVVRRADRFLRRGFSACRSEWRLTMATHNLLKLWKHERAVALPVG
jgi:Transposase DDE domain